MIENLLYEKYSSWYFTRIKIPSRYTEKKFKSRKMFRYFFYFCVTTSYSVFRRKLYLGYILIKIFVFCINITTTYIDIYHMHLRPVAPDHVDAKAFKMDDQITSKNSLKQNSYNLGFRRCI